MMAEYRLSSRAEADPARIADHTIETFGIEQARRYARYDGAVQVERIGRTS